MPRPKRTIRKVPKQQDYQRESLYPDADFAGRPLFNGMPVDQFKLTPLQPTESFPSSTFGLYGNMAGYGYLTPGAPQGGSMSDYTNPHRLLRGPPTGRLWASRTDNYGPVDTTPFPGYRGIVPENVFHRRNRQNGRNTFGSGNMTVFRFLKNDVHNHDMVLSAGRAYRAVQKIEDARVRQLDRRKALLLSRKGVTSMPEGIQRRLLTSAGLGGTFEQIGLAGMDNAGHGLQKRVKRKRVQRSRAR